MTDSDLPDDVAGLIGRSMYTEAATFPVEHGYIWTTCASVENGNPLFWDTAVAEEITGGSIAPPTMTSVWSRPHYWSPGDTEPAVPVKLHFDLKVRLELPEAVITENSLVLYEPVRIGDFITSQQRLKSVSAKKLTKLGVGRFWVIDIEYQNQERVLVGVETLTGFGYRRDTSDVYS